jgi:hypothetical protein
MDLVWVQSLGWLAASKLVQLDKPRSFRPRTSCTTKGETSIHRMRTDDRKKKLAEDIVARRRSKSGPKDHPKIPLDNIAGDSESSDLVRNFVQLAVFFFKFN